MPREGHDIQLLTADRNSLISIHVPREGHDSHCFPCPCPCYISIHVPREGHDRRCPAGRAGIGNISIHVPREGHDQDRCGNAGQTDHFNPRAPRGARPPLDNNIGGTDNISIHVPREGHDYFFSKPIDIYALFQSTCPARGTTAQRTRSSICGADFNPRAPRGARPKDARSVLFDDPISIHVPREGHDFSFTK